MNVIQKLVAKTKSFGVGGACVYPSVCWKILHQSEILNKFEQL